MKKHGLSYSPEYRAAPDNWPFPVYRQRPYKPPAPAGEEAPF